MQKIHFRNTEDCIKRIKSIKEMYSGGTPSEVALSDAIKALEKQLPKKPKNPEEDYGTFVCPSCGGLIYTEDKFETHKFCLLCGQAIDWND